MSPLERFQVLLKPEQLTALRQLEQRTGASVGALIRLAVDDWLGKRGTQKATSRPRATRGRKV